MYILLVFYMGSREKQVWTNSELQRLFHMSIKSRHTLIQAEERGEIPKANRIQRGSTSVRAWSLDQLPVIGSKYGFLTKPSKQVVLCVYTPKGGVLKTTTSGNIARVSALNGLKTLVIGLDFQKSLTNYLLPLPDFERPEEMSSYIKENRATGLYHLLYQNADINDVVHKTTIPTLDIIPETPDLIALEKSLRSENRREYIFSDLIEDLFHEYDLIILDNAPAWSLLTECSLTAANNVISPLGCDYETLQALGENFIHIEQFKINMKLDWDNYLIIPTLLENNNVSQDVYSIYRRDFSDMILPAPIRRTVKGQEARISNMSSVEYDSRSDLANDYYEMIKALWSKVLRSQGASN
jgi:chromosome partitioning protein